MLVMVAGDAGRFLGEDVLVLDLWPARLPVVLRSHGLVLREWTIEDAPTTVALFDTPDMNRWTPLTSPFDLGAALAYVEAAHRLRRERGILQLAVTEDGSRPVGEVLLFPGDADDVVELAYAVGAPFQGNGVGRRCVSAALRLAVAAGLGRARLVIATGNLPSQRVAVATGFQRTDAPLTERRRKGFVLTMATWERAL
jgi:RimJ/RimL family protein N-acetyltransferase